MSQRSLNIILKTLPAIAVVVVVIIIIPATQGGGW
jgi:hypothetical protein